MKQKNIIIAIDGYSSCGKSTLAKALAKYLNYIYIDTGAMYRAVTLYLLRNNIDIYNTRAVEDALPHIHLSFQSADYQTHIILNGQEVSDEIRKMEVSDSVSTVSAIASVRKEMVKQQQRLGKAANIVMDGRDIGTSVFPDAHIKLFMTADPKTRADRRYRELSSKGEKVTLEEVFNNIAHRDYMDTTRKESPLVRASDAIILDNTELNEEQQLAFAINEVEAYIKANS